MNRSPKSHLTVVDLKFWHVLMGVFIWEFVTTLDFEWEIIRGHRPYRWTIWIYSLNRMCIMNNLILLVLGSDTRIPISCQPWITFQLIFASLASVTASSLIVLRIIAIWNKNLFAVTIAMLAWSTNVAFFIYYTSKIRAVWVPELGFCEVINSESGNKTFIAALVTDVVLLFTMLAGLLRLRQHGTMFALGKLLWNQGLVWLFLATVAGIPPMVFLILNLNCPIDLMFQPSGLAVMSIAATRMYRSLTGFTDKTHMPVANVGAKQAFDVQPPLRVEVAVHMSTEGYPPPPN